MGGAHPKKTKKPSQFTNFGVATGFFWVFLGFLFFLVFFGIFLVFLGWHSNPEIKCQKIPKKKKTKKNQKKPKKPKNQFPISNVGQSLSQKKTKKSRKKTNANLEIIKNQKKTIKKPMPIYRFWCSDWFFWFFFG